MLGSNNYLGLTGDERVKQGARDALERYGTGLTGSRLLNGTLDLHLELEAELAAWMGTEDAIVFTTGHQANLGALGTLLGPGDTVVVDSGDHASILDGCLLSRAKMRPFRHNRLDKLERTLEKRGGRRRRRARGRRRRVLDGGRRRPAARDLRAVRALRRAADGRRGARGRRARRARRGDGGAARRRGPRRPAHGHLLEVAGVVRRLHRRPDRGHRVPARHRAPVPLHRGRGARRHRRRARRTAHRPLARGPASCSRRCSAQPTTSTPGSPSSASRSSSRRRCRRARRSSRPIVPVLVGDDWKAALLWKALYETPACTSTSRSTPPSRPAARCCAPA